MARCPCCLGLSGAQPGLFLHPAEPGSCPRRPRHGGRHGAGSRTGTLQPGHGRDHALDQQPVLRHAHLSDFAVLRSYLPARTHRMGARPLYYRTSALRLLLSFRFLSPHAQPLPAAGHQCPRQHAVGFQQLFLHHHCCRPHLEGQHLGLYSSHHCRTGACLSWQIPLGMSGDGFVYGSPDLVEPHPDELLFCLPHGLCLPCLWCRSRHQAPVEGVGEGHRRHRPWRTFGHCRQSAQPLSYVRIYAVFPARTFRTLSPCPCRRC